MDCHGKYFNLTPECKGCKDNESCGKAWLKLETERAFSIEDYLQ